MRKIERDTERRFKTITENLEPRDARVGEKVRIVAGAFAGWAGRVVEVDGEWRTVACVLMARD